MFTNNYFFASIIVRVKYNADNHKSYCTVKKIPVHRDEQYRDTCTGDTYLAILLSISVFI